MPILNHPIEFAEDSNTIIRGSLILEEPLPYQTIKPEGSGFYRPGKISLGDCANLDLVLYHNASTARFIYIEERKPDPRLMEFIGISMDELKDVDHLQLPGQVWMGAGRANLMWKAMQDIFAAPPLRETITSHLQENLAVFPIAREGLKYQVPEAIWEMYGYYTDEVILDAHHVFDSSVPVYNRKVEMTLFKDKDLNQPQHDKIKVAFIADSIASGLVMKEVIVRIKERFRNLERVEVLAPLATIRGLSRIAESECKNGVKVRVHCFETLLNALPPDYYYSAHFNIPEFHIRPDLEEQYCGWWGSDANGNQIANTACAGYGWSEVFYSPRKQIEMINGQLGERHNLTIAEIIKRNIRIS
ncbi:MAG: hypothetical protein CVU39_23610 [Chloroflexi bacterium HGW-Chloroflexi-10]|nr:MAG: hypothetical protein CVU39_23610 [Chloroflexi bacterium HGW-Chloroflexi-10]